MTEEDQQDDKKGNKIPEITSLVVTGIWLTALFTGQSWWLPALLVGYIVIVPLTTLLFGDDEDSDEEPIEDRRELSRPKRDALETLRDRYAHGELTEEQFERKLEALLDTETLENAEEWVLADTGADDVEAEENVAAQEWVSKHSRE